MGGRVVACGSDLRVRREMLAVSGGVRGSCFVGRHAAQAERISVGSEGRASLSFMA